MNLLPMLPQEQNSLLWGAQESMKPVPLRYKEKANLEDLKRFGLPPSEEAWKTTQTKVPDLSGYTGPLEALEGLLEARWADSLSALDSFLLAPLAPPQSLHTLYPGWTRYSKSPEGTWVEEPVPYPDEEVLLYDTETFVRGGGHPVLATACSPRAWYLWVHPEILSSPVFLTPTLVPLGPKVKGFIAHNALFDSSKTQECYSTNNSDRPWALCTMSLHAPLSGMGGSQVQSAYRAIPRGSSIAWASKCTGDSLADVLHFYTGRTLSKEARNIFVTGDWSDIQGNLRNLVDYAFKDTEALWWLWISLFPKFKKHCPSPITLCGLMELSRTQLPISKDFQSKILSNELQYQAIKGSLAKELETLIQSLKEQFLAGTLDPTQDPWLSQLDWTPAKSGKNKGIPAWIRKAGEITTGKSFVPLILKISYHGNPLVLHPKQKWGYIDPATQEFCKLPHPKGPKENVGSPFVKDFLGMWESGILQSRGIPNLPHALTSISYWESYRSRFTEEFIWSTQGDKDLCIPTTKLLGTLTGRQVHKLWLTAAQCKPGKLGTDLTHAVQARDGRVFVSWDEDTEEVRIAAVWGDHYNCGGLGSTPMSQYALMGSKSKGTDAHSLTAKLAGLSRQGAKVANFRDIFGGGMRTQMQALQSAHPDWPESKLRATVEKIMTAKRGRKVLGRYAGGTDSQYHNMAQHIAETPDFRLPMTQRQIPDVVNCRNAGRDFFTTRYNFPVQGTGADILHATAAIVGILAEKQGISEYGYVMARHDEICYEVEEARAEEFAEIGNSAHLWAWACFLDSLGFNWMPEPLCRLSAINIDKVYRKEVFMSIDAGFSCSWEFPEGREIH